VIRDAKAGLTCDAGDSAGLAEAVQILAAMALEERLQLGMNGRRYAEHEFGRTQLIDRLETMLAEAVQINKART
jgi:colanic acid biosynthesis glycosyl transferase WcaI